MSQPRSLNLTVHITETTGLTLFRVMKTTGPVDGDVALIAVQACRTFHATTGANPAELKETIEDRAVITDVVLALFFRERVHIIRRYL